MRVATNEITNFFISRKERFLGWCFLLVFLLCIVFLSSDEFIDSKVVPKWLAFVFFVVVFSVYLAIRSFIGGRKAFSSSGNVQGVSMSICFVIASLAIYGILQYNGIIGDSKGMPVSGNYDNPAGFAVTISAALPFVLSGLTCENKPLRIFHIFTLIISVIALVYSGSRSGLVSMLTIFLLGGYKFLGKKYILKWGIVIALVVVTAALCVHKYDSVSGRILIWICCLRMSKEHLLFGSGPGGFESHYMDFQASYLALHPDSTYAMLADTVQYPFNEYLYVLVNYGVCGLMLVFIYFGYMIFLYRKHKSPDKLTALLSVCAVAVFAMFSYPSMYPFTWFVVLYGTYVLMYEEKTRWRPGKLLKIAIGASAMIVSVYVCKNVYGWAESEVRWTRIAKSGRIDRDVLDEYSELYKVLSSDRYFMYN